MLSVFFGKFRPRKQTFITTEWTFRSIFFNKTMAYHCVLLCKWHVINKSSFSKFMVSQGTGWHSLIIHLFMDTNIIELNGHLEADSLIREWSMQCISLHIWNVLGECQLVQQLIWARRRMGPFQSIILPWKQTYIELNRYLEA